MIDISTHTPRQGSDGKWGLMALEHLIFQPTLPAKGVTYRPGAAICGKSISTHTPRQGSDACPPVYPSGQNNFNPHSPPRE